MVFETYFSLVATEILSNNSFGTWIPVFCLLVAFYFINRNVKMVNKKMVIFSCNLQTPTVGMSYLWLSSYPSF